MEYTFTLLCMSSSTSFSMPIKRDSEFKQETNPNTKLVNHLINCFTCNSKVCHTVSHFKSISHWLKVFLYRKAKIRPLSTSKIFHCISLTRSLFANMNTVMKCHPACLNTAIIHPHFPYNVSLKHIHILMLPPSLIICL